MLRHILVPVDGSTGAAHAARFGAFLARETSSKLTFLYVYDAPAASAIGLASLGMDGLKKASQEVARGSFEQAKQEIREFGVEAETEVRIGHPSAEIIGYAREYHPNLIVMGSRGLSLVQELLVGSVSDQVVRHAPCPVTVVR